LEVEDDMGVGRIGDILADVHFAISGQVCRDYADAPTGDELGGVCDPFGH
jgi:hypothetical protein